MKKFLIGWSIIFSIFLVLCFLFPRTSISEEYYSNDEWLTPYQESDRVMESIFIGLVVIDWFQTSEFRRHGVKEIDYFGCMGHEPDQGRINECIGLGIISHAAMTYIMPRKYRTMWNTFSITLEAVAIYDNFNKGYGVKIAIGGNF